MMSFVLVPEKIFVFTEPLTAVKGTVKTNIFSGTKTNEILEAPTI